VKLFDNAASAISNKIRTSKQYEARSNVSTTITGRYLDIFELTANVQCGESGVTGRALTALCQAELREFEIIHTFMCYINGNLKDLKASLSVYYDMGDLN
jgi:hypothetical protein